MIDSLLASLKKLASHGDLPEALKIFSVVRLHASPTNSYDIALQTIPSLLSSCTTLKSLSHGRRLHAHVISSGFERNPALVPKMVAFYSAFDLLDDAHVVAQTSNVLHTLPWNLLVFAYVRNGLFGEALCAYKEMVGKGIRADNFTYPAVLKACGERMDMAFGREVHEAIDACSQPWSLFVHNALIAMYARFGLMDFARGLFDEMPDRDSVSWGTVISAYASRGEWKDGFELFEKALVEGVGMNVITWNTIAGGWLRTGDFGRALGVIPRMRAFGVPLDSVALTIALGACSHVGRVDLGKEIHGFAIQNASDGFDNVKNALITMYSRCEELGLAHTVFRSTEREDVISWNSMLSGFAHTGRAEEASFCFREMLNSGVEPNHVTIACILPLCARVANLYHGKEFHCYITKQVGFRDHLQCWNSIIDMYARSGKISEAKRVFDSLPRRDEVTYTSMIAGYGVQGDGQTAIKLFEEMNKLEIKPDHITMVAVLSACSHSGLVRQGKELFDNMTGAFNVVPRLEHYSCMVDLFGRAGLIQDAKAIISGMPYEPTPAMWATLIGACRVYGDVGTGEWAAARLLELQPEKSGYYVLIANMFAAAERWGELARVRTSMRDSGVRKDPGCAWVDAGDGFVSFVVGDATCPRAHLLLDGLTQLMKDEFLASAVDYVLEDE